MDSEAILGSLRYYLAADSGLQSLFGVSTQAALLKRLVYKYSSTVQVSGSYPRPAVTFKLDDEEDNSGVSSNEVMLYLEIEDTFSHDVINLLKIKDRIKALLDCDKRKDNHTRVNDVGQSFSRNPKIRWIHWVSGINYDDKEQGGEKLHKYNCLYKLVVGD